MYSPSRAYVDCAQTLRRERAGLRSSDRRKHSWFKATLELETRLARRLVTSACSTISRAARQAAFTNRRCRSGTARNKTILPAALMRVEGLERWPNFGSRGSPLGWLYHSKPRILKRCFCRKFLIVSAVLLPETPRNSRKKDFRHLAKGALLALRRRAARTANVSRERRGFTTAGISAQCLICSKRRASRSRSGRSLVRLGR
jgi:hypothetical protein